MMIFQFGCHSLQVPNHLNSNLLNENVYPSRALPSLKQFILSQALNPCSKRSTECDWIFVVHCCCAKITVALWCKGDKKLFSVVWILYSLPYICRSASPFWRLTMCSHYSSEKLRCARDPPVRIQIHFKMNVRIIYGRTFAVKRDALE